MIEGVKKERMVKHKGAEMPFTIRHPIILSQDSKIIFTEV